MIYTTNAQSHRPAIESVYTTNSQSQTHRPTTESVYTTNTQSHRPIAESIYTTNTQSHRPTIESVYTINTQSNHSTIAYDSPFPVTYHHLHVCKQHHCWKVQKQYIKSGAGRWGGGGGGGGEIPSLHLVRKSATPLLSFCSSAKRCGVAALMQRRKYCLR